MKELEDLTGVTIEVRPRTWNMVVAALLVTCLMGVLYLGCWLAFGRVSDPAMSFILVFSMLIPTVLLTPVYLLVRITSHGVAVSAPYRVRRFAELGPVVSWDQIDDVVVEWEVVKLRGPEVTLEISTRAVDLEETTQLAARLRRALEQHRMVERGSDADRGRVMELTR